MKQEIDLLVNYPRTKRDINLRAEEKTEEDRLIARKFGKDFFDGDRRHGYGGFSYSPRFWENVIPTFQDHFSLTKESSLLDIGCAKGFMLYDLTRLIPGIKVEGIDISKYAIENSKPEIKKFCRVGNATDLQYENDSFDIAISITTIHNLEHNDCIKALKEIERVAARGSFITVDAYHNDEEKKRMESWNLTAKTVLHVDEWRNLFEIAGYTGDYYWFIP